MLLAKDCRSVLWGKKKLSTEAEIMKAVGKLTGECRFDWLGGGSYANCLQMRTLPM